MIRKVIGMVNSFFDTQSEATKVQDLHKEDKMVAAQVKNTRKNRNRKF